MGEALSRLWSQLGGYAKPLRSWNGAPRVAAPGLMVHEPSERVGGAMGAREAIRARALGACAAAFADHRPECSCERARLGPRAPPGAASGSTAPGGRRCRPPRPGPG